jgi:hypothetical protein
MKKTKVAGKGEEKGENNTRKEKRHNTCRGYEQTTERPYTKEN